MLIICSVCLMIDYLPSWSPGQNSLFLSTKSKFSENFVYQRKETVKCVTQGKSLFTLSETQKKVNEGHPSSGQARFVGAFAESFKLAILLMQLELSVTQLWQVHSELVCLVAHSSSVMSGRELEFTEFCLCTNSSILELLQRLCRILS